MEEREKSRREALERDGKKGIPPLTLSTLTSDNTEKLK